MGSGIGVIAAGNIGHMDGPQAGCSIGYIIPGSIGQGPVPKQERDATLHMRLLSGAQDIAKREGIMPSHATFEVRNLEVIMHGAAHIGDLVVCDWYDGGVRSLLYGCQ